MTEKPLVSIIVVNFRGLKFTRRCLGFLKKITYPHYEVILVDNGSGPKEKQVLTKEFGDWTKLVFSNVNRGFAGGFNLGLRQAKGRYVFSLNNDAFVRRDFLEPLVAVMTADTSIAVCQPKVLSAKNRGRFDYAGAAGGFIDKFGYPFCRGRVFFSIEKDRGQYDRPAFILWAGTSFLIDKLKYRQIGGFDEAFFAYAEEVDFCWRANELGYRVVYISRSVISHIGGATGNKNQPRRIYYVHRNHLLLLFKHYSRKQLAKILLPRLMMELLSLGYYLFNGYHRYFLACLKAYWSLVTRPQLFAAARQAYSRVAAGKLPERLIYPRSLVFDHYLRGIKTFSRLDFKVEEPVIKQS